MNYEYLKKINLFKQYLWYDQIAWYWMTPLVPMGVYYYLERKHLKLLIITFIVLFILKQINIIFLHLYYKNIFMGIIYNKVCLIRNTSKETRVQRIAQVSSIRISGGWIHVTGIIFTSSKKSISNRPTAFRRYIRLPLLFKDNRVMNCLNDWKAYNDVLSKTLNEEK